MIPGKEIPAEEEALISVLVEFSKPKTRIFELLYAEVQSFPTTLEFLAGKIVTSNLQSKEDLVATGIAVVQKLLVDQQSPGYESKIKEIMEGLWNVERWENYRHIGGSENSLQHSLRDCHLVLLLCKFEEEEGYTPDLGYLFPSFILHDMGEIDLGDTLYKDKTLSREREEYRRFCQLITFLSPQEQEKWRYYYLGQYIRFDAKTNEERFKDVTPSPLPILRELQSKYLHEGKIFDAAERLGYLLYAVHCFTTSKRIERIVPLIQVLRNQHKHLVRLSQELPGFGKYIYHRGVRSWTKTLWRSHEGLYLEE